MMSPVDVLHEAARRSLKLEAHGDELHVMPADRCTAAFVETLRDHKVQLLALLVLPFVLVDSKAGDEVLFFCKDDTKDALVRAGVEPSSIYTKDELRGS
jgi:hypothetical protein